ncbi:hypothetical protein Tco_0409263 [Tanacetum coccineum]
MQGTSLTRQEQECKLYDDFDKFTYKKGESLHEYYLRFTLLLNDMNIYKMPLEQFQVNTKFLNTLPDEWSKFVTDVKLESRSNCSSVPKKGDDPIDAINPMMSSLNCCWETTIYAAGTTRNNTLEHSGRNTGNNRLSSVYNYKGEGHIGRVIFPSRVRSHKREKMDERGSMISVAGSSQECGQVLNRGTRSGAYDSDVMELNSAKDFSLAKSFRNGSDALTEVHNPDNLACDLINQSEQIMTSFEQFNDVNQTETEITSDSNIIPYSQYFV